MKKNMGTADRIIRLVVGIAVGGVGLALGLEVDREVAAGGMRHALSSRGAASGADASPCR